MNFQVLYGTYAGNWLTICEKNIQCICKTESELRERKSSFFE